MDHVKTTKQRHAKFVCVIVCAFPDGDTISATGECRGSISDSLKGSCGFGYDPVFIPDGMDKTMAELTTDEKNDVSHRGKALREFSRLLKIYTAGKCV